MNEKLIEMALDACVLTYVDHETPRNYYISPAADLNDLNDFAMAIIQGCIEQVKLELQNRGQLLSNPPQNGGVWDACNNIRRHFGVK